MAEIFTYRKRTINTNDVNFLRQLFTDNPDESRKTLSLRVCREWNWIQPNGVLKDGICRGLMLKLHREGYITLPFRKKPFSGGRQIKLKKAEKLDIDLTSVSSTVKKLQPIEFRLVRRSKHEKLFNSLIEQYHYLGYTQPVGEHLKYLVFAAEHKKNPYFNEVWVFFML